MATRIVEVKVKVKGDGLTWDTREVIGQFHAVEIAPKAWVHDMTRVPHIEKAKAIGRAYVGAEEIRWNWKGSPQGHYHFLADDNGNNGGNNEQGQ